MKSNICARHFLILFILLSFSSKSFAQTTVIANEDDGTKYSISPFTNRYIKPNAFKDGSYIFYRDSAKTIILFEGLINKGLANGVYYAYYNNELGEPFLETKRASG